MLNITCKWTEPDLTESRQVLFGDKVKIMQMMAECHNILRIRFDIGRVKDETQYTAVSLYGSMKGEKFLL
mgnify:FL=1